MDFRKVPNWDKKKLLFDPILENFRCLLCEVFTPHDLPIMNSNLKNPKSEAVAGVIHFPFTGETHWGWVEHGNNLLDRNEQSKFNSFIISRSHTGNCFHRRF